MSDEGEGNKELVKLDDRGNIENELLGDREGLLEDGLSRANLVGQNLKDDVHWVVQPEAVEEVLPQPQEHSLGSTVCWERFLHLRSVRVLLVENDDCTRHVVAALLRNCSYEVVEASNGLQAWKVLEDLTNCIDIVLTEVVMPCFSGVGLLNKIMSHKSRKNVPVIMMSSHDSMGLVFKCLSKGAVDFLVKPIRKNELKILWQHVWRRCQSSSGSGSESGTHTQKSVKFNSAERSNDNCRSSDEEEYGSPAMNYRDGSDHGSGTQSSRKKQAEEDQVDSPRRIIGPNEIHDCLDSTCAQAINPVTNPCGSKLQSLTATMEGLDQNEPPESSKLVKALDTGMLKNSGPHSVKVPTQLASMNQFRAPKLDSNQNTLQIDNNARGLNGEELSDKKNCMWTDPQTDIKEPGVENKFSKIILINNTTIVDRKELPSTEQGLKRLRGVMDTGKAFQDERNVLRRSESSAFSRYNVPLHDKVSIVDARNLTPENTLDKKCELRHNIQSHSGSNAPYPCPNGGTVYVDIASTSNNRLTDAITLKDNTTETPTTKNLQPSVFQATKNHECSSPQPLLKDTDETTALKMIVCPVNSIKEFQAQPTQQQQLPSKHETLLIKKMAEPIPHCGSSTALGGHVEGNIGNCSANGSASGSNYGSNGQIGSSSVANAGGVNLESDNRAGDKSGNGNDRRGGSECGNGFGNGSGGKIDENKRAQREAALNKFREKRKKRCFKRKVRYQNRKRLAVAEQRPCVRGHIVQEAPSESTSKETDI